MKQKTDKRKWYCGVCHMETEESGNHICIPVEYQTQKTDKKITRKSDFLTKEIMTLFLAERLARRWTSGKSADITLDVLKAEKLLKKLKKELKDYTPCCDACPHDMPELKAFISRSESEAIANTEALYEVKLHRIEKQTLQELKKKVERMKRKDTDPLHSYMPDVYNQTLSDIITILEGEM